MKKLLVFVVFLLCLTITGSLQAQTINWGSLGESKHIINASLGGEYGVVFGLGYGYLIHTRLFPIEVGVDYSFPSGDQIFDDFKSRIGGQISLIELHHFRFNARIQGVFRRFENDMLRAVNFGSDMAATVGYYRPRWFAAGEFGFDKAVVTQFRHSSIYRDQFPGVVDGWYQPSTGGNFYFGPQAGFSFGKHDITLRGGWVFTQDFKTTPLIPYYGQLGYNIKF